MAQKFHYIHKHRPIYDLIGGPPTNLNQMKYILPKKKKNELFHTSVKFTITASF